MTPATFARRVLPLIETVEMPWGKQLVPVDELERLLAEHRRPAPPLAQARAAGRRPMLPDGVVRRIAAEHDAGKSLGQIARDLNADGVPTAQGGAQWWPSTVRVVSERPGRRLPLAASSERRPIAGWLRSTELVRAQRSSLKAAPTATHAFEFHQTTNAVEALGVLRPVAGLEHADEVDGRGDLGA